MDQYTDSNLRGREYITIAPDTHVLKASVKLGLIPAEVLDTNKAQDIAIKSWEAILAETEFDPIDLHTPLWLWSRSGFKFTVESSAAY